MAEQKVGTPPGKSSSRNKRIPAHGREVEIVLRAIDDYRTSRTRDHVAYFILGAVSVALILATSYGFYSENFSGLEKVWDAGPFAGGLLGYYFRVRKDSG